MLWSVLILCIALALGIFLFLRQPQFGTLAEGEALETIRRSPHYAQGEFRNLTETPLFTHGESFVSVMVENIRNPGQRLRPDEPVRVSPVNWQQLNPAEDIVIWLGHSSYFIQLSGLRILIDPVFSEVAPPVAVVNRAFSGTSVFSAADMPEIDYLLITHDHWDHLDYPSVTALRPKVKKVITGLGLGSYFRHWGYAENQVAEGDWNDSFTLENDVTLHIIPARHYSGRGLQRNQTLWVGFVLTTAQRRLLFSGDSGYGPHFAELGQRFGRFDLVALDQGQYDERWACIHMTPEQAAQAAEDLGADYLLPAHVGRFALARHAWDEPFQRMLDAADNRRYQLLTPEIGEPVSLSNIAAEPFKHWWTKADSAQ